MYYDDCTYRRGDRIYRRELLREGWREGGKVRKRTVANVTNWPEEVKAALRAVLGRKSSSKDRGDRRVAEIVQRIPGASLKQGRSVGALYLLKELADRIGLTAALDSDRAGRLALWQVFARIQDQGSRLSAVRLARTQMVNEVLGLDGFDEDDLYENLDWLCEHQAEIEDRLFRMRYKEGERPSLFLYDVTSTYLEGECNELAAFGYSRDKKPGKRQLVLGLLTDAEGRPLSVEVFSGNTADPSTVYKQIRKLSERFGGGEVTLVGDRGMLKSRPVRELQAHGMHYITAITRPQIRKLLKNGVLQPELFEEEIAEVWSAVEGVRYVVRRNELQARREQLRREDQLRSVRELVEDRNRYLAEHPRAQAAAAMRKVQERIRRYKLSGWVGVFADGRRLRLEIDEAARGEAGALHGCYVLKTDLPSDRLPKETVDERYRGLARVEWAFRTCKTAHLELRPVFVRRESRTRGHAVVVELAYHLAWELARLWKDLDVTVEEGLKALRELCAVTAELDPERETPALHAIPKPRADCRRLLDAAGVVLPSVLSGPKTPATRSVATKRSLPSRRK